MIRIIFFILILKLDKIIFLAARIFAYFRFLSFLKKNSIIEN
jgi:hypothetical protein